MTPPSTTPYTAPSTTLPTSMVKTLPTTKYSLIQGELWSFMFDYTKLIDFYYLSCFLYVFSRNPSFPEISCKNNNSLNYNISSHNRSVLTRWGKKLKTFNVMTLLNTTKIKSISVLTEFFVRPRYCQVQDEHILNLYTVVITQLRPKLELPAKIDFYFFQILAIFWG